MATELDIRAAASAQRMIESRGKLITLRGVGGTYNPATRETSPAPLAQPIKAVVTKSAKRFLSADGEVQAELAMLVARLSLPDGYLPEVGHKAKLDGRDYTVYGIVPTYSGELVAMYELHVAQ